MTNPYKQFSEVNPQWENGYRKIASDVFTALTMASLSGSQYRVALTIISCTWGFKRKSAHMTGSTFKAFTDLEKQTILNAIHSLEQKRIIIVDRKKVNGCVQINTYQFNKYYDTWLNKTGQKIFTTSQLALVIKFQKGGKQIARKLVRNHLSHNISSNFNKCEARDEDLKETEIDEIGLNYLNSHKNIKGPDR